MFAKIEVNGDNAAPLYEYLKAQAPNEDGSTKIPWNFTKFLVDRDGAVKQRFGTKVPPPQTAPKIEELL